MAAMAHTIRIKKDAPRRLLFEVVSSSGALLARQVLIPEARVFPTGVGMNRSRTCTRRAR
jgi:hypothetical protein